MANGFDSRSSCHLVGSQHVRARHRAALILYTGDALANLSCTLTQFVPPELRSASVGFAWGDYWQVTFQLKRFNTHGGWDATQTPVAGQSPTALREIMDGRWDARLSHFLSWHEFPNRGPTSPSEVPHQRCKKPQTMEVERVMNTSKNLPEIRKTVVLNALIAQVWEAVSTAHGIASWWMESTLEPVVHSLRRGLRRVPLCGDGVRTAPSDRIRLGQGLACDV